MKKKSKKKELSTKFVTTNCFTCDFWCQIEHREGANALELPGFCRRYPPKRMLPGDQPFPVTVGAEWCGEFAKASAKYVRGNIKYQEEAVKKPSAPELVVSNNEEVKTDTTSDTVVSDSSPLAS